jgi:hypothetical protein
LLDGAFHVSVTDADPPVAVVSVGLEGAVTATGVAERSFDDTDEPTPLTAWTVKK